MRSAQAQEAIRAAMLPHVHMRALDPAQFSLALLSLAALYADKKFAVSLRHRLQKALDQVGLSTIKFFPTWCGLSVT